MVDDVVVPAESTVVITCPDERVEPVTVVLAKENEDSPESVNVVGVWLVSEIVDD